MTEIILSIVFICASIVILIACLGLWRYGEKIANILYARIHITGVIDITCIILMFVLEIVVLDKPPILALAYFCLMPVANHAVANARYYVKVEEPEE